MNVGVKLTGFAAVTAAVFGLAFGVGSVLDPIVPNEVGLISAGGSHGDSHGGLGGAELAEADLPGLTVSSRGYTLRVMDATPRQGEAVEVAYTVSGPDGAPVLDFDATHEKPMHLIVVRRDLANFQHLHPERDQDGTWRVPVNFSAAGVYRLLADFSPSVLKETITLGTDVFVPGDFTPAKLPEPGRVWSADGYEVALAGTPAAGAESQLAFTVTRDGRELTDLEPYLGAFGHLVSLRTGDLAYLHTHPSEEAHAGARGGPEIRFGTTFPTSGRYRLYLNFAHGGEVRTAAFTLEVPAGSGTPQAPPMGSASAKPAHPDSDSHGH